MKFLYLVIILTLSYSINCIAQRDTTLYYDTGEKRAEGKIKDDQEFGEWKYYYKSGNLLSTTPHVNGYANGIVKNWYESGQLNSEAEYKNGIRNGKFTSWHENGQMSKQGSYNEGQSGVWKTWDEQGNLIEISNWKEDQKHGSVQYYINNKVVVEQNWDDGKLEGNTKFFNAKGKVDLIRTYENDVLLSEKVKSKKPKYKYNELEVVTHINREDSLKAELVIVRGEYRQLNVSYRTDITRYTGRAFIWINDTSSVMIESGELGIRPKNELDESVDHKVEIVGMLYPFCNAWGDGTQQTIVMPCIREVREVILID